MSIDCGAIVDGWHGDAAFSATIVAAGPAQGGPGAGVDPADVELVTVTEQALWHGIAAIVTGERLNAVGAAVEDLVGRPVRHRRGVRRPRDRYRDAPGPARAELPHPRPRARGCAPGCASPSSRCWSAGNAATRTLADEWTVVTRDGSRAAHWEHSVALTEAGPWVLTARDGGAAALGALGVSVAPLAD